MVAFYNSGHGVQRDLYTWKVQGRTVLPESLGSGYTGWNKKSWVFSPKSWFYTSQTGKATPHKHWAAQYARKSHLLSAFEARTSSAKMDTCRRVQQWWGLMTGTPPVIFHSHTIQVGDMPPSASWFSGPKIEKRWCETPRTASSFSSLCSLLSYPCLFPPKKRGGECSVGEHETVGGLDSASAASPTWWTILTGGVPRLSAAEAATTRAEMLCFTTISPSHTLFHFRLLFQCAHLYICVITFSQPLWFSLFKLISFPPSPFLSSPLSASPASLCGSVHGCVVSVEDKTVQWWADGGCCGLLSFNDHSVKVCVVDISQDQ